MNPDSTEPPEGRDDGHLRYLLTAYIFGDISAAGREEVETHLAACDECREEYELLVETIGVVGAVVNAPEDPTDYSFEDRRRERVLAASKRRGVIRRLPGGWFTAAAALLLVAILFLPTQLNRRVASRAPSAGLDFAVVESSVAADAKSARDRWGATSGEAPPMESPVANTATPEADLRRWNEDRLREEELQDGRDPGLAALRYHGTESASERREHSRAKKRDVRRRPVILSNPAPGGAPTPPKAASPAPEPMADPEEFAKSDATMFGVEGKASGAASTRGRSAESFYERFKEPDRDEMRLEDRGRALELAAPTLAASEKAWGFDADSEDEDTVAVDPGFQVLDELQVQSTTRGIHDLSVGLITPQPPRATAGFEGLSVGTVIADTRTGGESYGYEDSAGAPLRGGNVAGRPADKSVEFSQRLQGQIEDSPVGWSHFITFDVPASGPGSGGGGAGGVTATREPTNDLLTPDHAAPRLKPDSIRVKRKALGRFRESRGEARSSKDGAPKAESSDAQYTFHLTPPERAAADAAGLAGDSGVAGDSGISRDTLVNDGLAVDAYRRGFDAEFAAGGTRRGAPLAGVQYEAGQKPNDRGPLTTGDEFLPAQGANKRVPSERAQVAADAAGETIAPSEGAFAELAGRRFARREKIVERTRSDGRPTPPARLEEYVEEELEAASEEIDQDDPEAIRFYGDETHGWFAYDPQAFQRLAEADHRERQLRALRYFREIDRRSVETESDFEIPEPPVGDEGLGREGFRKRYGVNPFVDTRVDDQSTFAMDVDTAAYRRAVDLVQSGTVPEPDAVRVEAFVNSFQEDFPADPDHDFSVFCEGAPSPFGDDVDLLKITVKARELEENERLPSVLTLAIDTSGSMLLEERLVTVRQSLGMLLDALAPDDRVAVVAYGSEAYLALPHTAARERERILSVLEGLEPQGDTNVEAGLDLAYRVADESYATRALNRVVLLSDGVATSGARTADDLVERARLYAGRGLYLSVVGFGRERYDDTFLGTLAQAGNGNYAYVDSVQSAYNLFVRDLPSTIQVLARDAKIQVEFDRGTVESYRLLGYVNRDIADKDFRNDSVDAGEVGPGSTVTALYEIRRRPSSHGSLGRIAVRYHATTTGRVEELGFPLQVGVLATSLAEASDSLLYSASLAEAAELFMESYWARTGSFGRVAQLLAALSPEFRTRDDVQEFSNLVTRAQQLVVERLSQ